VNISAEDSLVNHNILHKVEGKLAKVTSVNFTMNRITCSNVKSDPKSSWTFNDIKPNTIWMQEDKWKKSKYPSINNQPVS
jgi:hypothetical protein